MTSNIEKYERIIKMNTFYFYNRDFEESYEGYINSIKELLLYMKNEFELKGLKKEIVENVLLEKENGLKALLTLTGFSNEQLKRIITLIRVVDYSELNKTFYKSKWIKKEDIPYNELGEWSDNKIFNMIKTNSYFRKGIVNLFFQGATIPFLTKTLPLFEVKKLSLSKLQFKIPELLDSLIRYKEKGSYSRQRGNNPEILIEKSLKELKINFEHGDLLEFIKNETLTKRNMDFIIPNKQNPRVIIECSYLVTTSSGQGDKSKTEISIKSLIKKHYPKTKFIGFIDGIGWYVRKIDLKRMVSAYDDVYTFHDQEIIRFKNFIIKNCS